MMSESAHFEPFMCQTCAEMRKADARAVILMLDTEVPNVQWACYCIDCGTLCTGLMYVNSPVVKRLLDNGATIVTKGDDPTAGRVVTIDPTPTPSEDGEEAEPDDKLTISDLDEMERMLSEDGLLENMVSAMAECGLGNPPAPPWDGTFREGMRVIDTDGDPGTVVEFNGMLFVRYDDMQYRPMPLPRFADMFRPMSNG